MFANYIVPSYFSAVPSVPACSRSSASVNQTFKKMIDTFEMEQPRTLTIQSVSHHFKIQSRRVHDFFNILCALNVCTPTGMHSYSWKGITQAVETIARAYTEFETSNESFTGWFNLGSSPTLGQIATKFMCLYFALGVNKLSMHPVSFLFSGSNSINPSLERRMYLVLTILEDIGFVSHVSGAGKFILTLDPSYIIKKAMQSKQYKYQNQGVNHIEALMNTLEGPYMDALREKRRETVRARCHFEGFVSKQK